MIFYNFLSGAKLEPLSKTSFLLGSACNLLTGSSQPSSGSEMGACPRGGWLATPTRPIQRRLRRVRGSIDSGNSSLDSADDERDSSSDSSSVSNSNSIGNRDRLTSDRIATYKVAKASGVNGEAIDKNHKASSPVTTTAATVETTKKSTTTASVKPQTDTKKTTSDKTSSKASKANREWQLDCKYTLSEVQLHSTLDDCWMVIFDKVYNITDFVNEHPGGDFILLEFAGRDATRGFLGARHGSSAYKMLDKYWIGILVDEELYYSNNSSYCSVFSNLSWRRSPSPEADDDDQDEDGQQEEENHETTEVYLSDDEDLDDDALEQETTASSSSASSWQQP